MQAQRMILETDKNGCLIYQPHLPPNISMEAIFLVLKNKKQVRAKRNPSKRICSKGKITGDIMTPVVLSDDWDVLQ